MQASNITFLDSRTEYANVRVARHGKYLTVEHGRNRFVYKHSDKIRTIRDALQRFELQRGAAIYDGHRSWALFCYEVMTDKVALEDDAVIDVSNSSLIYQT